MTTGLDVLDTSIQKTNQFLEEIEYDLGWQGRRHQAYQALRAVLHAIRDRLPIDQSAHLAAELPLFLKGVFYDGWAPAKVPIRMNRQEFLDYIRSNIVFDVDVVEVTKRIGQQIFRQIGPGETENILQALSPEIAEIFMD